MSRIAYTAAQVFDGEKLAANKAVVVEGGLVLSVTDASSLESAIPLHNFGDVILSPGFVDVQVNGGGGVMLNDEPSLQAIETIIAAHGQFGTMALLPTLITDTPEVTGRAVGAAIAAERAATPGFAGLHLEGPHLSVKRNGAHDTALIRAMEANDLKILLEAKSALRTLVVTVAPESVSPNQIAELAKAGVIVSLGHSDCSYDTAMRCFGAGATMVTHLFNAMSQLGNREPGLVGAALASGVVSAGLIVDGFHVHPAAMTAALRAKCGPGSIFLVTDSMSTVGSDIQSFTLNGRGIIRSGGRLTLADGTLAGADIDMLACVRNAREMLGLPLESALAMATSAPADALRRPDLGRLRPGCRAKMIVLEPNLKSVRMADAA